MITTKLRPLAVALMVATVPGLVGTVPTYADSQGFRTRLPQQVVEYDLSAEDVAAEVEFGRGVAARIFARYPQYEDEELHRYVNLVGKSVARFSGRPEIEFRFAVLGTDAVNAYACPGGYIFVTKGALDQMEDESELAAVLAHEIAHVSEKHIVRELNIRAREGDPAAGISRLLGGVADPTRVAFSQAVDKAVSILFERGLDKSDELSADQTGTTLLALAGYDVRALQRYLGRIAEHQEGRETITDTHPPFSDRVEQLAEVLRTLGLESSTGARLKERFDEQKG